MEDENKIYTSNAGNTGNTSSAGNAGKKKIAIAEDDILLTKVLKYWLKDDFELDTVYNGQELVDIVKKNNGEYLLVLTDDEMPLMTGQEVVKALRELYPTLPIFLMSGTCNEELALNIGATGFFSKPLNMPQIYEIADSYASERK